MKPITEIARKLGLGGNQFEPVGRYKAKLEHSLLQGKPLAHYVNVTAVNPTPAGEGKTVVAIGLAMALCRAGKQAIATLREPSLAPVFGIKGGGAGGGKSALTPLEDINLHFTGDLHAVAAANNLLAAMTDNHCRRRHSPGFSPDSITWRRVVDMSDKALSDILTGQGESPGPARRTGFDLTAASEVMAVLALATDLADLRNRLQRMVVAFEGDTPITAGDIGATGSMMALLLEATKPNLVQTCENTPALVHAGPFANIAHGNSSILADKMALSLGDYVITESGFGSDCGAEKFFHIKCRTAGFVPSLEVLVCTVRAIKWNSGSYRLKSTSTVKTQLEEENLGALEAGAQNLKAHIENLRKFGVPVVVAINCFPTDSVAERKRLRELAESFGAEGVAECDVFSQGSAGGGELAELVMEKCQRPQAIKYLYPLESSLPEKLQTLTREIYGGEGITFSDLALLQLKRLEASGFGKLPVCVAKTPFSLSHDKTLLGRPKGFQFPIHEVRLSAGAGFLYTLVGDISTLPGLPQSPNALKIDVDESGKITGLF